MSRAKPTVIGLFAIVFAARAQEHARLLEMRAGGDAQASSVELIGDRPLSFTTLKLAGPPRVVVDIADTDLAAPERDLLVEDGTIRRVAAAAAGSRTARVVIELTAEAEFDVRAVGNKLELRVPRIAPLLAQAEEPPPPPAAQEPAPQPAPQPQVQPQPAPVARETEAEKRASLPKVALVGSRPAVPPQPTVAPPPPVAEQKPAPKPPPAAIEKKVRPERRVAIAEKPVPPPKKAAAPKPRPAPPKVAAVTKARTARARAPERKVALAERPRHSITGIGFRPARGGEVIVRSDHPLEYGISGDGDAVLIHLPDTGIPLPNNRRPLDTEFFGGPVQRIVPVAVAGGTDVRIELKGHPEYQLQQQGSVLTVTFSAQP